MDEWLDSQGLYRKNTALDGTCLFRAVSEQLFSFHAPNGHAVLREECVAFMRKNRHLFEGKVIPGPYDEYVDNLSDSKQWAGQLELEALSLIYGVDFLVFKTIDLAPIPVTENGFSRKIMLCFTPDNFYDAVYPKSYIEDAGFCQSIVYGILYRGVFKLDDLEYAVEKMLHDKSARAQREKYLNSQSQSRDDSCYDFYLEDTDGPINMRELLDMGAILFPYKVAKALDPDIYRNIDFDNWVDTLRVPRKNSFWFGNGGPLRVGVKCALKLDDKCYNAHVQEMSPDYGPVLVFVEELGEKLTVPFENLEPLPRTSLKPEWTFSHKHQMINKLNSNKLLGIEVKDENSGKSKIRNKNRRVKDTPKYGAERRKDNDTNERSPASETEEKPPINDVNCKNNRNHYSNTNGNNSNSTANNNNNNNNNICNSNNNHHLNGNSNNGNSSGNSNNTHIRSNTNVVVAEPDSTTPSYDISPNTIRPQPQFTTPSVVLAPCGWTSSPSHAPPQPHIVKTINVMANKSVKNDCSDLPLSDLETVRFFFNLGIDYFRMGCLVCPGPPMPQPVEELSPGRMPESNVRVVTKPCDEGPTKPKVYKNQQKPPRFMKLENAEPKNMPDKIQRNDSMEENYPEVLPEQIPVAVPYTPQYALQYPIPYRVPGYPIQSIPESVPLEAAPLTPMGYPSDPNAHYMEPPYTIPYTVYSPPHFYYQN